MSATWTVNNLHIWNYSFAFEKQGERRCTRFYYYDHRYYWRRNRSKFRTVLWIVGGKKGKKSKKELRLLTACADQGKQHNNGEKSFKREVWICYIMLYRMFCVDKAFLTRSHSVSLWYVLSSCMCLYQCKFLKCLIFLTALLFPE